jgi:hypothetical protein
MKLSWLAAAVLGAATTHAVEQITAVGNKFFTSSGKQFFAKGIAYQLVEGKTYKDMSWDLLADGDAPLQTTRSSTPSNAVEMPN